MKARCLFLVFMTIGLCQWAQTQTSTTIEQMDLVMGIQQEAGSFYDSEGYSIFLVHQDMAYDDKLPKRMKKKYGLDDFVEETPASSLPTCRVFVTTRQRTARVKESGIYYVFPDGDGVRIIGLQTTLDRDKNHEVWCANTTIRQLFPAKVYTPMVIDSFAFAGRSLVLGSLCNWRGIRNVQCADYGQMNWSEFRTAERAKEMVEKQYEITAERHLGKVLSSDSVVIDFEGQKTAALKVLYRINLPSALTGGSNLLMVYYLSAEVRNRHVACVLSQYTYMSRLDQLAPLLRDLIGTKTDPIPAK